MAYGPKYSFDFETTNGTGIQILILEKDRNGLPVTRSLGRAPVLKREKSGCMHGTSIEIHAECKVDREFAQLYTSSADQFKVEVWKKPASGPIIRAKIWEGFVSPELYSEPDIAPPYDVQIIATDGLGELKNYRFEAAGRKTVMEHVRSLLSHTGLDITVDVVSSLQYDSQGGFMNAVVSLDHMKGESCYDVLKALLESFHASITLQDGMWKVWRETDLATLSGQVEVAEFGPISSADWWPVGQLSTVIVPAENEVTLISENAYKDNVLKDVAWQVTGDATFSEDEQAYVLGGITSMVSKYISFGAEVGYKLTLAVKARNVGNGEEDKPLGIKVEIDGRSYAAGDKFWLLEKTDGNYAWSNEEGAIEKLLGTPSQADTAADAKVITVELPLYSYDNRAYHYATAVKVTLFNPDGTYPVHVYDIALVKTQQTKGYRSVVQIANGARESAEETTLILADSDRIPAAAEVFMDGIPLNADGAPVSQWSSARVTGHGYLSFMSRDYALSHALPRMKVVGVLNVPASALITPMLYRRDNTYYFPETYDYDLLNDEISVNLVSIPTATISVSSEEVTEIVQEGTSIGITSGAGGGGGSSAPTGDFVTKDQLIAEIGPAAVIYLEPDDEQKKEANKAAIAAYVAAEVKPVLYPYGETRATAPFSVTYHEMEDGIEAIIQYRIALGAEPTMGEAYYLITAKILKDGSVEIQNDAPADYVLPTEEYVKEMIGEAYPVYSPLNGEELTEEQKAINKEAYDAVVAASGADLPQMPYLYPYDLGRQFPFIVFDYNVDDGYVEILLNADLMPVSLPDYGLPILSTGLASISEGLKLYADGSVTFEYADNFIAPSIGALMELAQTNSVETRVLFVSNANGSITAAQQDYNKETYSKIANGKIIQLTLLLIGAPVEHSYVDGVVCFSFQSLGGNGVVFHGQGTLNSDGSYTYEEYALTGGGSGGEGGITTETDPVFQASPAAKITDSDITNWNKAEANVQSDWNATDSSSDAYIKNKPTIPAAVTESTVSGWGFTKNTGTYSKPSTGIPKSDLASSVQTSLGKADTALQSYTEQYKGTVTGVKVNDSIKSPSNGVVDLGTIPTTIDASMSDSSTNPVQNKTVKAYVDSKVAAAGQMAVVAHGYSETSVEIAPNAYHRWTSTMSSLTVTLKSVSSANVLNYMMEFTTSSSGCVLTLPSNIKWANGNPPAMKPSTTYQISIINNLGVWAYYE